METDFIKFYLFWIRERSSPNATLIRSRRQFFHQRFFGTQLFFIWFDFFEEIGYQKTSWQVKKLLVDLIRVALGDEFGPTILESFIYSGFETFVAPARQAGMQNTPQIMMFVAIMKILNCAML